MKNAFAKSCPVLLFPLKMCRLVRGSATLLFRYNGIQFYRKEGNHNDFGNTSIYNALHCQGPNCYRINITSFHTVAAAVAAAAASVAVPVRD